VNVTAGTTNAAVWVADPTMEEQLRGKINI